MPPNKEDWINRKWRPMMGAMYFVVCIMDFVVFPVLWSMLQAHFSGSVTTEWEPLTLKGAGLFHMAMGMILGVAAWTRGQEKMAWINANAVMQPQNQVVTTTYGNINSRDPSNTDVSTGTLIVNNAKKPPPVPDPEQ